LKYHTDPAALVPPSKIKAKENSAYCKWGFTTLPGKANLRYIALLSLFDRTQGRVRGL